VTVRKSRYIAVLIALVVAWFALSHATGNEDSLPRIGPAPDFNLITQDGNRLSLNELRGRVVVLTFIFTSCKDVCPILTYKMATLQPRLGDDFGPNAFFVSVTVDPERDTPAVLKRYAATYDANLAGWAFLTGTRTQIADIVRRYGAYFCKKPGGDVDHTTITSLVDRNGTLRVQYLGVRFDPDELLKDIQSLLEENV
jgi:protein SCO1